LLLGILERLNIINSTLFGVKSPIREANGRHLFGLEWVPLALLIILVALLAQKSLLVLHLDAHLVPVEGVYILDLIFKFLDPLIFSNGGFCGVFSGSTLALHLEKSHFAFNLLHFKFIEFSSLFLIIFYCLHFGLHDGQGIGQVQVLVPDIIKGRFGLN
jgi:hypothetical protein